ncbi:MAG: sulfotransferase [Gammaproteobacteria bacterium]|nr:sulfotransferase [Gammaproteobacteria bacterium]
MGKKRLVVVLGMHRSGTSIITRGLNVLGVSLGDNLMPPYKGDNEKGFWEDLDFNNLNIEMLKAIGSDWHHLALLERVDVEFLRKNGYFARALDLINEKMSVNPIFGLKDPRIAKMMPFWKEVFARCHCDVSYILTIRHPMSVVRSLTKRNAYDVEKSYILWLEHVIASLDETAGSDRVLVDYDQLMQSPEHELTRIAEYLDYPIDTAELAIYQSEFLEDELRHSFFELGDLSSEYACHPLVKEVYALLVDVTKNIASLDDIQPFVEKWKIELERQQSLLMLTDKIVIRHTAAIERIENFNHVITENDSQVKQLNLQNEQLNLQNEQLNLQNEELNHQVEHLNLGAEQLSLQNEQLNHQVEQLNLGAEQLGLQNEQLNHQVEQLALRAEQLDQKLLKRDEQLVDFGHVVSQRDSLRLMVDEISTSTSWRITAPLRWFRRSLVSLRNL